MSNNFSGNIKKNARSFQPQGSGTPDVLVAKTAAGGYEQGGVQYLEPAKKADSPILETDATPRTDGLGERELNLSVDHPDNDGGAKYLAGKIARVYRQLVADGAGLENLSIEERLALRNRLVFAVIDGGNQEPNDADSAHSAHGYVTQVASLLFGLIDELPGTPDFLRAPKPPTSDDDRVGRFGADYLRLKADFGGTLVKSAGTALTIFCPILTKNEALHEVSGVIADESVDKSGEAFDYSSSEPYFKAWSEEFNRNTGGKSFGNVREQHSPRAVGKLIDIQFDSLNKKIPVTAKIVDPDTWTKIQSGVLTGFSIAGKYLNKWHDGNNVLRYTAVPAEVSVVDNPCNPSAAFSLVKDAPSADGMDAIRVRIEALKRRVDEMVAPTGPRFVTKGAANDPHQLMKQALANGTPASAAGDGDRTTSTFKALGTGERGKATHYSEIERQPFQPKG